MTSLHNILVRSYALQYEKLGWSVIPISFGSKKSMVQWKEYQSERLTVKEIEEISWQSIGIVTGSISGICVIDEDTDESSEFTARFPKTLTARTGKGTHYYFRLPVEKRIPKKTRFLPGLDCQAEGGYVVAPPSTHDSGNVYTWMYGWEDHTEPKIAELPEFVIAAILSNKISTALAGAVEGNRNNTLHSMCLGILFDEGGKKNPDYESRWNEILFWATNNLRPPLPEDEIRTTFEGTAKWVARQVAEKNAISQKVIRVESAEFDGSAEELLLKPIQQVPHTIDGILTSGLGLLVGKAKTGKSRLALQLAFSVALGAPPFNPLLLNYYGLSGKITKGHVLYIALEDTPLRLQNRLSVLLQGKPELAKELDIHFVTQYPPLYSGGVWRLKEYLDTKPETRLVIIDTLVAFTLGIKEKTGNAFTAEYEMLRPLADIVAGRNTTILVIHHARKDPISGMLVDPFDNIVGTLGTNAAADTLMMLYERRVRGRSPQSMLIGKGRDLDGYELPLKSKGILWTIEKEEEEVQEK